MTASRRHSRCTGLAPASGHLQLLLLPPLPPPPAAGCLPRPTPDPRQSAREMAVKARAASRQLQALPSEQRVAILNRIAGEAILRSALAATLRTRCRYCTVRMSFPR